jgi:hypothetical protein
MNLNIKPTRQGKNKHSSSDHQMTQTPNNPSQQAQTANSTQTQTNSTAMNAPTLIDKPAPGLKSTQPSSNVGNPQAATTTTPSPTTDTHLSGSNNKQQASQDQSNQNQINSNKRTRGSHQTNQTQTTLQATPGQAHSPQTNTRPTSSHQASHPKNKKPNSIQTNNSIPNASQSATPNKQPTTTSPNTQTQINPTAQTTGQAQSQSQRSQSASVQASTTQPTHHNTPTNTQNPTNSIPAAQRPSLAGQPGPDQRSSDKLKSHKSDKPPKKKKGRNPVKSLIIIALVAGLGYQAYTWIDAKFQKQKKYINENFSESVDYMMEEYEKDNYVRGLHDIKDPFEGWEHHTFHTVKMRYPPDLSTQHQINPKPTCNYANDRIDFTSQEYRLLQNDYQIEDNIQQKLLVYSNAVGFSFCHFPNNENLELRDFVHHPHTWLPDSDDFNGKVTRSKILKNWNKADLNRENFTGYFYKGEIQNSGDSKLIFFQDLTSKDIYIIDLDETYHPQDKKSTEHMEDILNRIITSFR